MPDPRHRHNWYQKMAALGPDTSYSTLEHAADKDSPDHSAANAKLVVLYQPFIKSVARKILVNIADIEDVTQNLILKLFVNGKIFETYEADKPFRPYLKTCVRRACFNLLRQRNRGGHTFGLDDVDDETTQSDEHDAIWARTIFFSALVAMKAECKEKGHLDTIWKLFQGECVQPLFSGAEKRGRDHYGLDQTTYGGRIQTGYRKLRRFLLAEIESINSVESQHSSFRIIGELMRVPISNEPMIKMLLSKTFRDKEVSQVFLSDNANGEIADLHPPINEEDSPVRRDWLQLLRTPLAEFFPGADHDERLATYTIDDAIFLDIADSEVKTRLKDEAKKLPERFAGAPENGLFKYEIRQILVGVGSSKSYRAIYTVSDKSIHVLTVRRAEQDAIIRSELLNCRPNSLAEAQNTILVINW